MTTFTIQDLNTSNINDLPTTPEEDEAMRELFEKMGKDLANHEIAHQQAQQNRLNAVPPQPTLCEVTQTPTLTDIINNICTQLQIYLEY